MSRQDSSSKIWESTGAVVQMWTDIIAFFRQQVCYNRIQSLMKRLQIQHDIKRLNERLSDVMRGVNLSLLETIQSSQQGKAAQEPGTAVKSKPAARSTSAYSLDFALPPNPQILFGRSDEVELLVKSLMRTEATHLAILGPGGIGKTAVATAVLHDVRIIDRFSPYRVFVSCEGLASAEGIIATLARFLKLSGQSDPRNAILLHLLFLRVPILLVLDNLESAWDTTEQAMVEEFLEELANIGHLSLVVTMRGTVRPARVDWTLPVISALQPLDLEAARQIFVCVSHQTRDEEELDTLLNLLDGLPLAITLMAHQGQILSAKELLQTYDKEQTRLLRRGRNRRLTSLEVSIEVSLNSLTMQEDPQASNLLSIMCLLPDGMEATALPPALPSMEQVRQATQTLLRVALIIPDMQRVRVLSPIRDFILLHYQPSGPPLDELRRHFMNMTFNADNIGTGLSMQAVTTLSTEFNNINSVLLHFWRTFPNENQPEFPLAATLHLAKFTNTAHYSNCMQLLGEAKLRLEAIPHAHGVAQCIQSIGDTLYTLDRYEESIACLEEAKASLVAEGDLSSAAQCSRNIGDALLMLDRYDEALPKLEQASSVLATHGDRLGAAQCSQSVGEALRMLTRYDEAIVKLEEAKASFESIGFSMGAASCMRSLADILRMQKRYDAAVFTLKQAKATFDACGHRLGATQCVQIMGNVLRMTGRYEEAEPTLQEAKKAFELIGDRGGAARITRSLGEVLRKMGRTDEAIATLEEAEATFDALRDRRGVAQSKEILGAIFLEEHRNAEAEANLSQAMKIFDDIGNERNVEACRQKLVELHSRSPA
ncbi:TPR-like protein [Calocera viscosa TUFC12733]|uniref:TPR-like protein n=1 Tax=Calocera viscosa (strain TUFC12733) TaxID=1330018 RepID=A0A167K073_CALVF|nr:TPR-like protein [Calocera viscosa TUFC12733]